MKNYVTTNTGIVNAVFTPIHPHVHCDYDGHDPIERAFWSVRVVINGFPLSPVFMCGDCAMDLNKQIGGVKS